MTDMQQTFLYYTLIYFIIKGGLYIGLYVVTIMIEKHARDRYAKLRILLNKKRKEEEERWKTAYNKLYQNKYNKEILTLRKAG